jgi:hypothetical protein
MILNIFSEVTGMFNENLKDSFLNAISLDFVFIFIIVIFILIIFLVFSFLILPLFKPSPAKLYRKYLYFRDEMKRIDALYSQKKIIFDEYVSMQFVNAQEYYRVVKLLSLDPNYKSKLQSYTLKDNSDKSSSYTPSQNTSRKLTPEELLRKQASKICDVLTPKANNYSKEDIYSVLLYEGFEDTLIRAVLKELLNRNVIFAKFASSTENKKDLSLFLDDLINGKGAANFKNINTSESISFEKKEANSFFKDDYKRKELNFDKIDDVDYTFKTEPVVVEEKPSFFKRLFGVKKKKEAPKPSINEVDNILKNIEQELKTKEV